MGGRLQRQRRATRRFFNAAVEAVTGCFRGKNGSKPEEEVVPDMPTPKIERKDKTLDIKLSLASASSYAVHIPISKVSAPSILNCGIYDCNSSSRMDFDKVTDVNTRLNPMKKFVFTKSWSCSDIKLFEFWYDYCEWDVEEDGSWSEDILFIGEEEEKQEEEKEKEEEKEECSKEREEEEEEKNRPGVAMWRDKEEESLEEAEETKPKEFEEEEIAVEDEEEKEKIEEEQKEDDLDDEKKEEEEGEEEEEEEEEKENIEEEKEEDQEADEVEEREEVEEKEEEEEKEEVLYHFEEIQEDKEKWLVGDDKEDSEESEDEKEEVLEEKEDILDKVEEVVRNEELEREREEMFVNKVVMEALAMHSNAQQEAEDKVEKKFDWTELEKEAARRRSMRMRPGGARIRKGRGEVSKFEAVAEGSGGGEKEKEKEEMEKEEMEKEEMEKEEMEKEGKEVKEDMSWTALEEEAARRRSMRKRPGAARIRGGIARTGV